MELGRVAGQVVATVRAPNLPHNSLLLVDILDREGNPTGGQHVAIDTVGAGEGEWVILVRGSSARNASTPDAALDLAIVAIVDHVTCKARTVYTKN